jgi:repressor of nif and glnA expression
VSYSEHLERDRRLVLLRVLKDSPGYVCNEYVLGVALEECGHSVSRETIQFDLTWLDEQGLVTLEIIKGTVCVATVTQRGIDVALGRTQHPGVKRPAPGV